MNSRRIRKLGLIYWGWRNWGFGRRNWSGWGSLITSMRFGPLEIQWWRTDE